MRNLTAFLVLMACPVLHAGSDGAGTVFHCAQGSKQERHFNFFGRATSSIVEIQETDDAGSGTADNGGQILIRQLGAITQIGHKYLATIELSSLSGHACVFPNSNPFVFTCNASQTESNIVKIELRDLTSGQTLQTDDFSIFSIRSIFRTDILGTDGSIENNYRFKIVMFGIKNPWPSGASEELVFTGDMPGVQSACQPN